MTVTKVFRIVKPDLIKKNQVMKIFKYNNGKVIIIFCKRVK